MLFIEQVIEVEVVITKTLGKALLALVIAAIASAATMTSAASLVIIGGTLAMASVPFGVVAIIALLLAEYLRQQITSAYNTSSKHITNNQPIEEQVIISNIPSTEWLESELTYLSDSIHNQLAYLEFSIPRLITEARWEVGTIATSLQIPDSPTQCYPYWTNGEVVGQEESFDGLLIPTQTVKLTKKPTTKVKKAPKSTSPSKAPSIALEAMGWKELLGLAKSHGIVCSGRGRTKDAIKADLLKVIRQ